MYPDSNLNTMAHLDLPLVLSILSAFSEAQTGGEEWVFLDPKIGLVLVLGENAILSLSLNIR